MTLAELIARLEAYHVSVHVHDGRPILRFPGDIDKAAVLGELGEDITTHRDGVLSHFAAVPTEHPGSVCATCGAICYHASAIDRYRLCGSVYCPAWREGLESSPEWVGKHRSDQAWAAKKAEQRQAAQDEAVPE